MVSINVFPDEERRAAVAKVLTQNSSEGIGNYNTGWTIYDSNMNQIDKSTAMACFANLPTIIQNLSYPRYVSYRCDQVVGVDIACKYIKACQKSGILGDTLQSPEEIEKFGILIDLSDPIWSVDRLYSALCCLRYMREMRHLVTNMVELIDVGVPFWLAFVFCHGHNSSGWGHGFIGFMKGRYSTKPFTKNSKLSIGCAQYFRDFYASKDTNMEHFLGYGGSWTVVSSFRPNDLFTVKSPEYILSKDAEDAFNSDSKDEIEKILKELNEKV